ncbi:hypothetical protein HDU76_012167 [Blyttiomyces sp. JEL0837]|nr:hypothetical protein HDU76_012167 [Blyttiomyces sp. JEL0837]
MPFLTIPYTLHATLSSCPITGTFLVPLVAPAKCECTTPTLTVPISNLTGITYDQCNANCANDANCFSAEYDVIYNNCETRTLKQAHGVFFTLPWWNSFPQIYPVGNNGGVDPSTPYGAQGLTHCQYDIILHLTSVFENGSPDFNWASCGNINDGNGYSAGFVQFTTLSGSALQVVRTYVNNGNANGNLKQALANYIPALQNVRGSGSTAGLDGFCNAWANAANNENTFQDSQRQIQEADYLAPNHDLVNNLGLKLAVSVGQLFDSSIQLGLGGTQQIVNNVRDAATPRNVEALDNSGNAIT